MADTIPNLWSNEIKVDVATPLMILRAQAGSLGRITKGILEAEVIAEQIQTEDDGSGSTTLIHFDLIAPAINRSGYRILTARYWDDMAYPTDVQSEYFDIVDMFGNPYEDYDYHSPANEDEFIKSISNILKSRKLMSLMQSLIARSNEQLVGHRAPSGPG